MCGIFGLASAEPTPTISVFEGLKKLEYRGYDSAGIVCGTDKSLVRIRQAGKLKALEPFLDQLPETSCVAMGHTRWATHGEPTTENAHPHITGDIAVIHNGIIENHAELKLKLIAAGTTFSSATDTEVILHLLRQHYQETRDQREAILATLNELHGAYGLGVIFLSSPRDIWLVKEGSPLVIGLGEKTNYFASDALALAGHTKEVVFLKDSQLAKISPTSCTIWNFEGIEQSYESVQLNWEESAAEKRGFPHYMLKEIHEQPEVIRRTIEQFLNSQGEIIAENVAAEEIDYSRISNIKIVGCGTAYYAGLVSKYHLEPATGLPVSVELASEFRYRQPYLDKNTLVIALTQSGETMDTLASIKHAKSNGCQTLAICNVAHASIPRECNGNILMLAGPEVGVASTKAFLAMVASMSMLGAYLGRARGLIGEPELEKFIHAFRKLPNILDALIARSDEIREIAEKYSDATSCIFLGRGAHYPIALEGALKLKEISYIHAEGYAAGELKHGPIALIDSVLPVVALAPEDRYLEKSLANIQEVVARKGHIIGVGTSSSRFKELCADHIPCPSVGDEHLQTLVSVVPLQLFAYYLSVKRGADVDQPRNLAKSVTVE